MLYSFIPYGANFDGEIFSQTQFVSENLPSKIFFQQLFIYKQKLSSGAKGALFPPGNDFAPHELGLIVS